MLKRISNAKHPRDINQMDHQLVELSTSEQPDLLELIPSPAVLASLVMAEMGRRGGQIGGKRRLQTMTKAQRKKAASNAAKARWRKARNL
jgi:hypothetical protein